MSGRRGDDDVGEEGGRRKAAPKGEVAAAAGSSVPGQGRAQPDEVAVADAEAGTSADATEATGTVTERHHELAFRLWGGARYHQRRIAYFRGLDSFIAFLTLGVGSGTVATWAMSADAWIAGLLGALATAAGLLAVVVRPLDQATAHRKLLDTYLRLEADLEAVAAPPNLDAIGRALAELDEPPQKTALLALVHNEYCRRIGAPPEEYAEIPPLWRLVAHVIDCPPEKIRAVGDSRR